MDKEAPSPSRFRTLARGIGNAFNSFFRGGVLDANTVSPAYVSGDGSFFRFTSTAHEVLSLPPSSQCMAYICDSLLQIPFSVESSTGKKAKKLTRLLSDFLDRSLDGCGRSDFLKRTVTDMVLYGNAYVELAPPKKRSAPYIDGDFVPIHPQAVRPKIDEEGKLQYIISAAETRDSVPKMIPASRMLHFRYGAYVHGSICPQGIIETNRPTWINAYAYQSQIAHLVGKTPAGIVTIDDMQVSKSQQDTALIKFREDIEKGGIALLAGKGGYNEIGTKPKDIMYAENYASLAGDIIGAFGIPDGLIITKAHANNNLENDSALFVRSKLAPLAKALGDELSRKVLQGGYKVVFDTDAWLMLSAESKIARDALLSGMGAITPNEARANHGFEPIDEPGYNDARTNIANQAKPEHGEVVFGGKQKKTKKGLLF